MKIAAKQKNIFNFSRQSIIIVFIILAVLILIGRLFFLMIIKHGDYEIMAANQHLVTKQNDPNRGNIYVHDRKFSDNILSPVAINKRYYLLYAVSADIKDPAETAKLLAPLLSEDETVLLGRLAKKDDNYEPLKRRLEEELKNNLEATFKNLKPCIETDKEASDPKFINFEKCLKFEKEIYRYYPEAENMGQILGFVGYSGDNLIGQYGVESWWQKELSGDRSEKTFTRDGRGRLMSLLSSNDLVFDSGSDLVLTIDRTVQFTTCNALKESVLKHGAAGGSVVIIEPSSGAVIAMCNYPDFDPNNYQEVKDYKVYNNAAVFDSYEAGSVIKVITMAAALDTGSVTPQTTYEDSGAVKFGSYTIQNSDKKAHGIQTMTQVLELSLNTGAIFAARKVGTEMFLNYLERFGFGATFDLPFTSERGGDIGNIKSGGDLSLATASFGQGFTATPLQLAAAFSAIANKGRLMKPYLVEEVKSPDGKSEKFDPQFLRQVISEKTAANLSAMLVSVIKSGHGRLGGVDGYYIGGKTGTAQMPDPRTGKYSTDSTIHTFAGFGPISDPRFVMITKIVSPKDAIYAESTAAPLFGEIAKFLLNYMKVPPDYVK